MTEDLDDIDEIITNIRKVDSNIHYYTINQNSDEGFMKKSEI